MNSTPSLVADEAVVERVAKALRDLAMKRALREHGPGQMIPWQAFEEDAIAALQQVQTVDGLERVREE